MANATVQGIDVKTSTEVTNINRLPNDDKFYLTGNSLNKTLKQAKTDGDFGGPVISTVTNSSSDFYPVASLSNTYVTVPYTSILNRRKISDFGLRSFMGSEPIMIQNIYLIKDEYVASGLPVWGIVGDKYDQVRLVGTGWAVMHTAYGKCISTNVVGDYLETAFQGTGINLLYLMDSDVTTDIRLTVDGGSEGSNIDIVASGILQARYYGTNQVWPLINGLTFGLHNTKLRRAGGTSSSMAIYGFQVLNESSSITVLPGSGYTSTGKRQTLAAQTTTAYNAGISGTKGARVVKYLLNGSVSQAVQEVDATVKYLANTDHTNESPSGEYSVRQFGCGRSDDFSTAPDSASSRAFVLDDNTTGLIGNGSYVMGYGGISVLYCAFTAGTFYTHTFVGSGLDIEVVTPSSSAMVTDIYIDGSLIGTKTIAGGITYVGWLPIVSGLPHCTHTVKFALNSNATLGTSKFRVYSPKKPSIPAGALEINDYCVNADFVPNSVDNPFIPAMGTIRHMNCREFIYTGTWATDGIDTNKASGIDFNASPANDSLEFVFEGVGIDYRFKFNGAIWGNIWRISIDGNTDLSGYSTALHGAGLTWVPSTGYVTGTSFDAVYGCGIRISGLPYGVHRFKLVNSAGVANPRPDCVDVISLVYCPKKLSADYNQPLLVGSNSLGDFTALKEQSATDNYIKHSNSTTSYYQLPFPVAKQKINFTHQGTTASSDIVINSSNNMLYWKTSTVSGISSAIAAGTYNWASLATAIQTAMNAGESPADAQTYTVTFDQATQSLKMVGSGTFAFTFGSNPTNSARSAMKFLPFDQALATTQFGERIINDLRIRPAQGSKIIYKGNVIENPGYLAISRKGVNVTLYAVDATTWTVIDSIDEQFHKNVYQGDGYSDIKLVGRNFWTTKANNTSSKNYLSSFVLNGYGYNIGGCSYAGTEYSDVSQYNDATNVWMPKASEPTSRHGTASFQLNGYGYTCNGYTGSPSAVVNKYTDSTNTWSNVAASGTAKHAPAAFMLNGYGFICNGWNGSPYNTVTMFNDNLNSWVGRSAGGSARYGLAGFSLNGYGLICDGNAASMMSEVNQYNDSGDFWITKPVGGVARFTLAGFGLGGYGYICCGQDASVNRNYVDQFNDCLNVWTSVAPSGSAKYGPTGLGLNGYGYLCSGVIGTTDSNETLQYN